MSTPSKANTFLCTIQTRTTENRTPRSDLGGGVILTQIHEIDYLQWLFGVPEAVYAVGGRIGNLEIDVEDSADALFRYQRDGRTLAVHLHVDYLQRQPRRRCRVTGENGVVEVDLLAPSLLWRNALGEVQAHEDYQWFTRSWMFLEEMRHFLEAVDGRRPVEVDVAHATATLRIASAMHESMSTALPQYLG